MDREGMFDKFFGAVLGAGMAVAACAITADYFLGTQFIAKLVSISGGP